MKSNPRSLLLPGGPIVPDWLSSLVAAIAIGVVTTLLPTAVPAQSIERHSQQAQASPATGVANSQTSISMPGLPLGFEVNKGQMDPAVKYAARGSQYTLFLTSSEAVFALPVSTEVPTNLKSIVQQGAARQVRKPSVWTSVGMRFVGANPAPVFSASDPLPGTKNYFVGRDKTKWATGVPLYSRVESDNVYPGIDLAFRGVQKDLEFDFLISPGADPRQIKMAFEGAQVSSLRFRGTWWFHRRLAT